MRQVSDDPKIVTFMK